MTGKYRVQPYDEGDHTITLSLQIYNLQPQDFGEYKCVASNNLGKDSESMFLYGKLLDIDFRYCYVGNGILCNSGAD